MNQPPRFPGDLIPNRPDALGVEPDSLAREVPYGQVRAESTKYLNALRRLVARLESYAGDTSEEYRRGKRSSRMSGSATARVYLRSVEIWSGYCYEKFGRELDPGEVSVEETYKFAKWMLGGNDPKGLARINPDTRGFTVRSKGDDAYRLFQACIRATRTRQRVTIADIANELEPDLRAKWGVTGETYAGLHDAMIVLTRELRVVDRLPPLRELRAKYKGYNPDVEKNPLTYRYEVSPAKALKISSVAEYLSCLSAVWREFNQPESGYEGPPLRFNPWTEVARDYARRTARQVRERKEAGESTVITTPLVKACLLAAAGVGLEQRRDTLLLNILARQGLRSEEIAAAQRQDVKDQDGVLILSVVGKGRKRRTIALSSAVRDALTAMDTTLQELTGQRRKNNEGIIEPSYGARYAAELLEPTSPLCPSLVRWGANARDEFPEVAAREPLDVSGIRAIISRIAERARVREVATGVIRPLSAEERQRVHPHSFRHYYATAAQKNNVPIRQIQEDLGHATLSTTETYVEVFTQKSLAASTAVGREIDGGGPLTPEQVASFTSKARSAIDQPEIEPARPEDDPNFKRDVSPSTRIAPEDRVLIANPYWAYDKGDDMLAYLPTPTATIFSADNAQRLARLEAAEMNAAALGDTAKAAFISAEKAAVSARYAYLTLRIGRLSRLPWWAGRANRWTSGTLAPVPSPFQIAGDDQHSADFGESLDDLFAYTFRTRGPSAASSMVFWLTELVQYAGVALWSDAEERGDKWIAFSEPAYPDAGVVREHEVAAFEAWLEEKGIAAWAPEKSKSAGLIKNPVMVNLQSLPDWFWLADPIAPLPDKEKKRIQEWILILRGRRTDRRRVQRRIERLVSLAKALEVKARAYRKKFPTDESRQTPAGVTESQLLGWMRTQLEDELARAFPEAAGKVTAPDMVQAIVDGAENETVALTTLLVRKGAALDGGGTGEGWDVTMRSPRERARLMSPEYLTWQDGTVRHSEQARRAWFEAYGTDSECVVRRALRAVWERRRLLAAGSDRGASTRLWEQWLAFVVPCAPEMEKRLIDSGWVPPATPTERLAQLRQIWQGFVAWIVQRQGVQPKIPALPQEVVDQVFGPLAYSIERFVEATQGSARAQPPAPTARMPEATAPEFAPYEDPAWQRGAQTQAPRWTPPPALWETRPYDAKWPGYPLVDWTFENGLGPATKRLVDKSTGQLWAPVTDEDVKLWKSHMRTYARWRRRFTAADRRFEGPHMLSGERVEPAKLRTHGWEDPEPEGVQWLGYPWISPRERAKAAAFYVQLPVLPGQPLSPFFNESMRAYARWKRSEMGARANPSPDILVGGAFGAPTVMEYALLCAWPESVE